MKKIKTYGSLIAENKCQQSRIRNLETLSNWLRHESVVQRKVISQLKQLFESKSPSQSKHYGENYCNRRHLNCKIDHDRFNLVKKTTEVTIKATSFSKPSFISKKG